MATTGSCAQHFIECENCEENPAQFLCKTCPGHLCETCKTEHETKKITKNHEIIHLHRNRNGTLGVIYCAKHTANKLEWYCSPCEEPVCSKCLMESHNGHKLEDLAAKYPEIISKLKEEKKDIERVIVPKYKELLSKEKTKKSEISKRTDEVKKQIENHSRSIIDQVTKVKEKAIQNLQEEEKKALQSVADMENEIEKRIEKIWRINEDITNNIGTNPGITFFTNIDYNTLRDMQGFLTTVNYKLDDFQPGGGFITANFGKFPEFSKSRETILKKNDVKIAILRQKIKDLEIKKKGAGSVLNMGSLNEDIKMLETDLEKLERAQN